jgi:alanyl-tRNA synthetase
LTDRLYYHDPDLLEFEAVISSVHKREAKVGTVLDRSAFYPTSGGQLHDIGRLNGVAVIDVEEDEDGQVVHVTESTVGEVGRRIQGAVDAERRWRHRQQHTAQHILSALCANLYNAETVSVHLGESYGAVELDVPAVSDSDMTQLEAEANRVVREAQPVEILLLSPEEAQRLALRRPPAREGIIRIIKTGELDWSACGGTHCRNTAQVGLIKLAGTEKLRGHCVVRFLAGV